MTDRFIKTKKYKNIDYPSNLLNEVFPDGKVLTNDDLPADIIPTLEYVLLSVCTDREFGVVHARYRDMKTLDTIGSSYGVTRERIRQVNLQALNKLMRAKDLLRLGLKAYVGELLANERSKAEEEAKKVASASEALIEARVADLAERVASLISDYKKAEISIAEEDNKNDLLETQIWDLDLSVRSFNCLTRHGIKTVGELVQMTEKELLLVRNLGRRSYEEVVSKIESLGLSLRINEESSANG